MALYIPHSIFHLARLLYVKPETFGPYYVFSSYASVPYTYPSSYSYIKSKPSVQNQLSQGRKPVTCILGTTILPERFDRKLQRLISSHAAKNSDLLVPPLFLATE